MMETEWLRFKDATDTPLPQDWQELAQDRDAWHHIRDTFIEALLRRPMSTLQFGFCAMRL